MSYTDTHEPTYAYLGKQPGPKWTVHWVWQEKTVPGRTPKEALTRGCAHEHRTFDGAIKCAKTRTEDVRF